MPCQQVTAGLSCKYLTATQAMANVEKREVSGRGKKLSKKRLCANVPVGGRERRVE